MQEEVAFSDHCRFCGEVFQNDCVLVYHVALHHRRLFTEYNNKDVPPSAEQKGIEAEILAMTSVRPQDTITYKETVKVVAGIQGISAEELYEKEKQSNGIRAYIRKHDIKFQCQVPDCHFQSLSIMKLIKHEQQIHKIFKNLCFHCDFCPKAYHSWPDALAHRRIAHSRPSLYVCDKCAASFCLRQPFNCHMKEEHEVLLAEGEKRVYTCLCDEKVAGKTNYRNHRKTCDKVKRNFLCKNCGKTFMEARVLRKHEETNNCIKFVQKNHESSSNRKTKSKGSLRGEVGPFKKIRVKTKGEYEGLVPAPITGQDGKKIWVCPRDNCDKTYRDSYKMRNHIHIHDKIRQFKCPECPMLFYTIPQVYSHRKSVHLCKPRFDYEYKKAKRLAAKGIHYEPDLERVRRLYAERAGKNKPTMKYRVKQNGSDIKIPDIITVYQSTTKVSREAIIKETTSVIETIASEPYLPRKGGRKPVGLQDSNHSTGDGSDLTGVEDETEIAVSSITSIKAPKNSRLSRSSRTKSQAKSKKISEKGKSKTTNEKIPRSREKQASITITSVQDFSGAQDSAESSTFYQNQLQKEEAVFISNLDASSTTSTQGDYADSLNNIYQHRTSPPSNSLDPMQQWLQMSLSQNSSQQSHHYTKSSEQRYNHQYTLQQPISVPGVCGLCEGCFVNVHSHLLLEHKLPESKVHLLINNILQ
jgi:hypothetical protein